MGCIMVHTHTKAQQSNPRYKSMYTLLTSANSSLEKGHIYIKKEYQRS